MSYKISRQPQITKRSQNTHSLIVFQTSGIHGMGGFARVDLRGGKRLIEYLGQKISKAESQAELQKQNVYIFTLDDDYDVDGSVEWNPARFLNHSCDPNCEAEISGGRIWIYTRRAIMAGEELTYNYNYDLEDYENRPCLCGADSCVNYMVAEEFFARIRKRQAS